MDTTRRAMGMRALYAAALGLVVMVGAFVGVKLAQADPGQPVGDKLTVSGVLRGVGPSVMVEFRFFRAAMGGAALCSPVVPVRDGIERDPATGAFSVEVPLRQMGRECPGTLFHDPNAYVEVAVGGTLVVPRAPVNPVPYANYTSQYGTPDCPVGYERDRTVMNYVVCQRRDESAQVYDEVVRVGSGPSAFWIDRYEASTHDRATGSSVPMFRTATDFNASVFPRSGQWRRFRPTPPVFALSRRATTASLGISWFQAVEACAASGKRLPTGSEWTRAAQGTIDPASGSGSDGSGGACATLRVSGPRETGMGTACVSAWGAEDMIGNLAEVTDEWFATVGNNSAGSSPWPEGAEWGGDIAVNIDPMSAGYNAAAVSGGSYGRGGPVVAVRGGDHTEGVGGGLFSLNLGMTPSAWAGDAGFRCMIPR